MGLGSPFGAKGSWRHGVQRLLADGASLRPPSHQVLSWLPQSSRPLREALAEGFHPLPPLKEKGAA